MPDIEDLFKDGEEVKPDAHGIAANSFVDTLYTSPFDSGKFLNITTDAISEPVDGEVEHQFQVSPKVTLTVTYIEGKQDTNSLKIQKHVCGKGGVWADGGTITLSSFTLARIKDLLEFLSSLDLGSIAERRIQLAEDVSIADEATRQKITTVFSSPGGAEFLQEFLNNAVTSEDVINLGYRRSQLEEFRKLLEEPDYVATYKAWNEITAQGEEAAWQFFFQKNEWILGYGLNYQYLNLVTAQPNYGGAAVVGGGTQRGDYLMSSAAIVKFTVLVEIKTPNTPILSTVPNRNGSFKISTDLAAGISQVQVNCQQWHRQSGTQENVDALETDDVYTREPKGILIIGSTTQLEGDDARDKRNTYASFIRNMHNPEVVTFDELYERAKFMVGTTPPEEST